MKENRVESNLFMKMVDQKQEYDQLIRLSTNVNLTQTWEFGQAKAEAEGLLVARAAIYAGNRPIAVVQMLGDGNGLSVNRGPVVLSDNWKVDNSFAIQVIEFLQKYWTQERRTTITVAPNILETPGVAEQLVAIGLIPTGKGHRLSIRVDLSKSEEDLRRDLRPNWRRRLSKSERLGLTHELVNDDASFQYFLKKHAEFQSEKGFAGLSGSFLLRRRETCNGNQNLNLFFVLRDNKRISAMLFGGFFDTYHMLVGWNDAEGRNCDAHNYIYWNALLYSKAQGYRWFDMGGIDPIMHPTITFFKRGIGGTEFTIMPEFAAFPAND